MRLPQDGYQVAERKARGRWDLDVVRGALPFSDADTGRSSGSASVPRPSDEGKEKSGF
jgi:hypothetical protein